MSPIIPHYSLYQLKLQAKRSGRAILYITDVYNTWRFQENLIVLSCCLLTDGSQNIYCDTVDDRRNKCPGLSLGSQNAGSVIFPCHSEPASCQQPIESIFDPSGGYAQKYPIALPPFLLLGVYFASQHVNLMHDLGGRRMSMLHAG